MSKCITSYFTVISKKKAGENSSSQQENNKQRLSSSNDDDDDDDDVDDVKEKSVSSAKHRKIGKRRNKARLLIDSEDEATDTKEKPRKSRSDDGGKLSGERNASVSKSSKKQAEPTKRRILSDSEEEIVEVKRKTKSVRSSEKDGNKAKKLVSVVDMFGTKPVKRTAAPKPQQIMPDEDDELFCVAAMDELEKSVTDQDVSVGSSAETNAKEDITKTSTEIISKKEENGGSRKASNSDDSFDDKGKKVNGENPGRKVPEGEKKKTKTESVMRKKNDLSENSNIGGKRKTNDKSYKKVGSKLEIDRESVRKRKRSNDDEDVDPCEAAIQKKKQHLALYQQYLHRGGARNPGSKEIPTGAENCLADLSFLITGVLDSLERSDAEELIKKYAGHVQQGVTKKTDYIVVGDEPGPAKLEKAKKFAIKTITEDDLLELIRTRPAGPATEASGDKIKPKKNRVRAKQKTPEPEPLTATKINPSPHTENKSDAKSKFFDTNKSKNLSLEQSTSAAEVPNNTSSNTNKAVAPTVARVTCETGSQVWVEKYKPKSMKQIIGQQGDKSNAQKLHNWLKNWHKNRNGKAKQTRPSPWAQHDGSFFKAALLSGPPGVGKTTTVQLVCDALQLDAIEFNASDTRSKRLLKEEISELLNNKSMKSYFVGGGGTQKPDLDHVLVMDEVDGMAGNEDRGGLQELIALIKTANVPVICICNDRNNPKMRTLSNYTFDLRFQKPRIEQIRSAMMSICFKEKIELAKDELDRLIESTNNDIRQILNHLTLLANDITIDETPRARKCNKDLRLGPWDVVPKVFAREAHKTMSIHDKSALFFHDYNIAPLFVQENYLGVVPNCPKNKILEAVADAAESLALGDLVENSIRQNGAWSLLPMQACYSSVIPGTLMSGQISRQIAFPSWLGQNSRRGKFDRLLQEITSHTRLATMSSKEAINLDYLKHLRDAILRPLAELGTSGASAALEAMNCYSLLREDLDSLVEVSLWPGNRDPMQAIDSKVKAAFTRAYNKSSPMRPYAFTKSVTGKKKRARALDSEDVLNGEEEEEEKEEEEEGELESENEDDDEQPVVQVKKSGPKSKKTTSAAGKGAGRSKKSRSAI